MTLPIALQLYTVRNELERDFEAGIAQVADIGYRHVELAGMYDRTPAQVKALFDDVGITAIASHLEIEQLVGDLGSVIQVAAALGFKHVACPYLPESYRSPAGYREAHSQLLQAASRLHRHGLSLSYHNHSFEFEPLEDGTRGMDILYDDANGALRSELDVYWVRHGRDDPIAWMRQLSGRVPLLHVKDMSAGADGTFVEVGTGTLDMQAIVDAVPGCGVQVLIVEQDGNWINGSPFDSARLSLENLKEMV